MKFPIAWRGININCRPINTGEDEYMSYFAVCFTMVSISRHGIHHTKQTIRSMSTTQRGAGSFARICHLLVEEAITKLELRQQHSKNRKGLRTPRGHVNHSLFWKTERNTLQGEFKRLMNVTFGLLWIKAEFEK